MSDTEDAEALGHSEGDVYDGSDDDYDAHAARAARVLPLFKDCSAPPPQEAIPANAPPALKAMWELAAEWHLLPAGTHYGVFGFNLDNCAKLVEGHKDDDVLGDAKEWGEDMIDGGSVARPGWFRIAAYSEFEFLYCSMDPQSDEYGHVRGVVNNCCQDYKLCTAAELVEVIELAVLAIAAGGIDINGAPDDHSLIPLFESIVESGLPDKD